VEVDTPGFRSLAARVAAADGALTVLDAARR
jgi:hypothetical protein